MNTRFSTALLTCSAALTLSTVSAAQTMDDTAIREVQTRQADAWNRHVAPGLAIAHVLWTMSGAKTPPGIPEPREGIQMQVLKKVDGKWLIYSFQNTNSVPERPFPKGPPTAGSR